MACEPQGQAPRLAREAVLVKSVSEGTPSADRIVKGYDFDKGVDLDGILNSYKTSGFQATSFAHAVDEINKMVAL